MDDRDKTATEKPFEDEVKHPPETTPTPDDKDDPKREREAAKTTQRQE